MPLRLAQSDVVPTVRLELTRLSPPPPQDGVSTNSTTSAVGAILPLSVPQQFPDSRDQAYFGMSDGRLAGAVFSGLPGVELF